MKFFIKSDIPDRIRITYGRDVFSEKFESAIEKHFLSLDYVFQVKAHFRTGSIILYYDRLYRTDLLYVAKDLNLTSLKPIPLNEEELKLKDIDEKFKNQLTSTVTKYYLIKFLLPRPIRWILTIKDSLTFFKKGINDLLNGKIGVEVLDATSVGISIAQGYPETASSIMFLLNISALLEEYTLKKTKSVLSTNLLKQIDNVWVEKEEKIHKIPIDELEIGDTVLVQSGLTIPVDGKVIKGEAIVNQSTITGEPLGVLKKSDESVFAGTVVEEGNIFIEVKALENDTHIKKVVDLISESEDLKASIQGKSEKIADAIVPFSFLLAAGVYAFTRNLTKALSVLLVDYSCAIKLATPVSVISAMKEMSTLNVVVKGGKFFEEIAEAETIIFDKTGTLTVARPTVTKVIPTKGYIRDEVLRLAACMEEHFPHSVARAVVKAAKDEGLNHEEEHTEVEYLVAHGIVTTIHGKKAILGSYHFVFEDEGVELSKENEKLINDNIDGGSAIYLALDDQLAGFIFINDPPRPEASTVIKNLKRLGIKETIMLTGDNEQSASEVSKQLGIDRYYAEILPEDKLLIINKLKAEGKKIIMVGDGINDSPALAAANVSISMQDSSDIAKEVADITLLESNLSQILTTRIIGQKLMQRIHNNFKFIVVFNTALLALGIGNIIMPGTSALLHNVSTVAITASSTRSLEPKDNSFNNSKLRVLPNKRKVYS